MCCVLTVSANVGILGVARFYASGAYFRSTKSGSLDLFTKLLQQNTRCSCKDHSNPQSNAMSRRGKARKQEEGGSPGATVQDAPGGHSGRFSPSEAGPSSSFPSPSQLSEYSPSPDKARQQATRRVPLGSARETSQPISAAPAVTFARMSRGRGQASTIRLIHEDQKTAGGQSAVPAPTIVSAAVARKASLAGSHMGKAVPVATNAKDLPGDDQQTQDAVGQDAAPHMHFQVRIGTSRVHAVKIVCRCCVTKND